MTLEEAQIAKIDMALGELGLLPGMTLFDIGCGWGATMRRAIEEYDVNVIGLTLSKNQAAHVQKMFEEMDCRRSRRVLLRGWEQFDEPVDRIVSIGAFEHFGHERYARFFELAYHTLPADGAMLLESQQVYDRYIKYLTGCANLFRDGYTDVDHLEAGPDRVLFDRRVDRWQPAGREDLVQDEFDDVD